jgi:hypothetical protein
VLTYYSTLEGIESSKGTDGPSTPCHLDQTFFAFGLSVAGFRFPHKTLELPLDFDPLHNGKGKCGVGTTPIT